MPSINKKTFSITYFEPVKIKDELYGKEIQFNIEKQHIRFSSEFHKPTYVPFNQIEKLSIIKLTKKNLLWWSICTFLLFIGIFLFLLRVWLPPYVIKLKLKNIKKTVKIRARINEEMASALADFLSPHIPTLYISNSK